MVPGLGAGGKFQLSAGWRYAYADKSYFNSRLNHGFTQTWQPEERLSVLDLTGQYNINSRFSLTATMPIAFNHFSTLFPPLGKGRGVRQGWEVSGLSDISIFGRGVLLDPARHPFENVAIGVGIKVPTGYWYASKRLPAETGTDFAPRALYPPAVYPGDGGVGILFGYNAYKFVRVPLLTRRLLCYTSATYLSNPRDTNGTPSMISSLGVPLTPNFLGRLTNSVADSYSLQAGASIPIPNCETNKYLKGLRFRPSIHLEGLNTRDLFGANNGFRQPGYALAVSPGATYQFGKHMFVVDVPIVFNRHINPGATSLPGLPVTTPQGVMPARFSPTRQMGLVAPLSLSIRYVRTM